MRAIRFDQTGGPEVLELVEVETPTPAPGQVLVRHQAIGLNFIDTYQRSGLYPMKLPVGPGLEAAGVVEAVGEGVTRFKVGDRVAYAGDARRLCRGQCRGRRPRPVKLPDGDRRARSPPRPC